jgi:hypothetical protein
VVRCSLSVFRVRDAMVVLDFLDFLYGLGVRRHKYRRTVVEHLVKHWG